MTADTATGGGDTTKTGGEGTSTQSATVPGTIIGRYVVLEEISRGGMGVVYQAYDPELDRRIALKLLRVHSADREASRDHVARLHREAQALAQLSHPNVVTVFDVGHIDDEVFIAMELIGGQTLRPWLSESERSVDDIIDVFIKAGTGLAAAHRADLVHRDFKPGNVMVDDNDRVRVLDFGIAFPVESHALTDQSTTRGSDTTTERLTDSDSSESTRRLVDSAATSSPTSALLHQQLTRAGVFMGTPAYMAPEQHRRKTVDHRCDQFSFCVALFEALCGRRPYEPRKLARIARGNAEATPPELPTDHRMPTWVKRIVMRGLAIEPDDRFPSMTALLAKLQVNPRVARRRVMVGVGASALVAVALWGVLRTHASPELCTAAPDQFKGVWDRAVATDVKIAFAAIGGVNAEPTFARVSTIFDQYRRDWGVMRTEACAATRVRGEQSARLMDLRMTCLDRRRQKLGALTRVFAQAKRKRVIGKAVAAAQSLARISDCADTERLGDVVSLPSDPKTRAAIEALQHELDSAEALRSAGLYKIALGIAHSVTTRSQSLAYLPLQADAHHLLGRLQHSAGDPTKSVQSLRATIKAAALARDDFLVARAWIDLAWTLGEARGRLADALSARFAAETALARAGDPGVQRLELLTHMAVILLRSGDHKGAETDINTASTLLATLKDVEHLAPRVYDIRGRIAEAQGRSGDALRDFSLALKLRTKELGPLHPQVAAIINNRASLFQYRGELTKADHEYRRALLIFEKAFGTRHRHVASLLNNVGEVATMAGRYNVAEKALLRALSIRREALRSGHPRIASSLIKLGELARVRGRLAQALKLLSEALALRRKSLAPTHFEIGNNLAAIGYTYALMAKCADAAPPLSEASIILAKALPADHPSIGRLLIYTATCELTDKSAHVRNKAVANLDRAVKIFEKHNTFPSLLVLARFKLAQSLWRTPAQRKRGLALARSALALAKTRGGPAQGKPIKKWINSHEQ